MDTIPTSALGAAELYLRMLTESAPVHTLLTGKPGEFDRRVEIVRAPKYGLVGSTAEIQARVVETGKPPSTIANSVTLKVRREGQVIYDSGELRTGDQNMCHSLANMEDHHFKYSQHRRPGDVHLHFFGTSRLSFGSRAWTYQPGDRIQIAATGFCEPLVNTVSAGPPEEGEPVVIKSA